MSRTARDIMTRDVVSVSAEMELRDLAKLFLEKQITGAPVVDEWSKAIGVVSQTDLINYTLSRDDEMRVDLGFYQEARINDRQMPAGFQLADTRAGIVSDIMTPVVHAVSEEDSVEQVAEVMTSNHIHRVIVLRHGRLAGVISALDVLKTLVARQPC
jgi:CBS-domain-containing membrane protein